MSETFSIYKWVLKPTADWLLALMGIIVLMPAFFLVALIIKIDSKGPVFFRQERLGKEGKVFRIFKFRSMKINSASNTGTDLFEDDPRITKTGRFIRRTSIDELPQLINILKGEMSFIGPRPPVTYFPKIFTDYSEKEKQRFRVKPGISGLAQTRCREIHDWDINIPIDIEYVNNYSFGMDLKLFITSMFFFIRTDNIYRERKS